MKNTLTPKQSTSLQAIVSEYPSTTQLSRKELTSACAKNDLAPPHWIMQNEDYKVGRGLFRVPVELLEIPVPVVEEKKTKKTDKVSKVPTKKSQKISQKKIEKHVESNSPTVHRLSMIPEATPNFVKHGHYKDVENVVKSGMFFPIFITGLSGNGKTLMVENVCANLKREMVRVNITIETDEDDLLGGFRLENGETKFHKGPVVEAMESGAVLLLDEVDLASNKILCLQPVLEGKGVYLKKINQWVRPADGFTVIATANTKGKGSDSGAFVGTNILNEAFLERFSITMEQEYPSVAVETKILQSEFSSKGIADDGFAKNLVDWADMIRKTFYDGGIDEIISTRRLVHIANAYSIFQNTSKDVGKVRIKAIELCIARFDDETKEAFKDLYEKVDAEVTSSVDKKDMPF